MRLQERHRTLSEYDVSETKDKILSQCGLIDLVLEMENWYSVCETTKSTSYPPEPSTMAVSATCLNEGGVTRQ